MRVYFEETHSGKKVIANVRGEIIAGVRRRQHITTVTSRDACDFNVFLCPIVSRAGTDIEEKLRDIKADKPTIVVVLHCRLNPESPVPNSSLHEKQDKKNLIFVDFVFNEDKGLLLCGKNEDSFRRVDEYLKQYGTQKVPSTNLCDSWMLWLQCLLGQDPNIEI